MASHKILSSLLRFRRSLSKSTIINPRISPSTSTSTALRSSPLLFNGLVEYSTSAAAAVADAPSASPSSKGVGAPSGKITDEFTGAESVKQVCHVIGVVDIMFTDGLPPFWITHSLGSRSCSTIRGKYGQDHCHGWYRGAC